MLINAKHTERWNKMASFRHEHPPPIHCISVHRYVYDHPHRVHSKPASKFIDNIIYNKLD